MRSVVFRLNLVVAVILFVSSGFLRDSFAQDAVELLERAIPASAADCTPARTAAVRKAATELDDWAAARSWEPRKPDPNKIVAVIREVVESKQRADASLQKVLKLRGEFLAIPEDKGRRNSIRQFLQVTATLIDLSGRLQATQRDTISHGSYDLSPYPKQIDELLDLLAKDRVEIGAAVMSYVLFDPPASSGFKPYPAATRKKTLELIAATKQIDLMDSLDQFLRQKSTTDSLKIVAAETIRAIGLPQDARQGQEDPPSKVTAGSLHDIISSIDAKRLNQDLEQRRIKLLEWLARRMKYGVEGGVFRYGNLELRSGDWLLMRGASPYNMFSDLTPGLFTHVGVVTVETDAKGIRRFLLVDLPERGAYIPATPVDTYLKRTLHYFFLRHEDLAVQQAMGQAGADVIGNETQFDLTFRTDRVLKLKGKPLKGRRLNTYCAGFLLLCAQTTSAPRTEFFPVNEHPPGGHCQANLKRLGLSIGDNFISPTGALFSSKMSIVGRRNPIYSPLREVKEAVYDHFAYSMVDKKLTPAPNTLQALRAKFAGLAKYNPWLAKELAKRNNVSEHLDLEAAAQAAAVVETLDEIADGKSGEFSEARQAFMAGPVEQLAKAGLKQKEIERIKMYRKRHQQLYSRWLEGLSPRDVRIELVQYYQEQGTKAVDERFFRSTK